MKNVTLSLALIGLLWTLPAVAHAQCFADYKAKRDAPLRLHYGVVELSGACTARAARTEIQQRLAPNGWVLLNVLGVFGPEGLAERKDSAGRYYLRF